MSLSDRPPTTIDSSRCQAEEEWRLGQSQSTGEEGCAGRVSAEEITQGNVDSSSSFRSGVLALGQKLEVKQAIKNMSEDLPPMNDIESMFDHLVSRVPDITKLVDQLNGRKLRVATMCS